MEEVHVAPLRDLRRKAGRRAAMVSAPDHRAGETKRRWPASLRQVWQGEKILCRDDVYELRPARIRGF